MSTKTDGWLTKQGGKFKSWKKRWFMLKDRHLHYYKDPKDKSAAGSIFLKDCTVAAAPDVKKTAFTISGPSIRTFVMYADTESDMNDWMKAIAAESSGGGGTPGGGAGGGGDAAGSNDVPLPDDCSKDRVGLEDFDLLKVIGRGAFGKVMLVRKKDSKELFAMKILAKEMLIKRKQVDRTKAESQILRIVRHPFVVGLKYGFQTETKLYLVLDYVNGGDLFVHLQNKRRFSLEQARLYGAEMVLAFEHLHKHNIVYRDLKPENILMGSDGHICLTDFGLSKEQMGAADKTNSFCGTPEYLAPEILQSQGYGKDVDWWSLGILIFEMLVGRPPFYSENVNEMYEKILQDDLVFPPAVPIPDDAQQLIQALLQRDPKQRLGFGEVDSAQIKQHAFFSSIDWAKLMEKAVEPPFKPTIASETDTSNFDTLFTDEAAVLTVIDSTLDTKTQQQFQGFTYVDKSALDG